MTSANSRTADHAIDPLFLQRWSPRAFDGSALTEEETMTLFEAARWAPSSYNSQPWRFVYARRGTPAWPRLLDLLVRGHRALLSPRFRSTGDSTHARSPRAEVAV